jgi:hypothetical protein
MKMDVRGLLQNSSKTLLQNWLKNELSLSLGLLIRWHIKIKCGRPLSAKSGRDGSG